MSATTECVPNIGPLERRRRMAFGLVFLGVGVAIGLVLLVAGFPRAWRLAASIPVWLGAIGVIVMQAHEKTCIAIP